MSLKSWIVRNQTTVDTARSRYGGRECRISPVTPPSPRSAGDSRALELMRTLLVKRPGLRVEEVSKALGWDVNMTRKYLGRLHFPFVQNNDEKGRPYRFYAHGMRP